MIEAIHAFIYTVWPRLFACLVFGFGTSFIPWMFEIKWWFKILLSVGIFCCWLFLGITLEIIVAVRKRSAERRASQERLN
jgi:hypothetical protein